MWIHTVGGHISGYNTKRLTGVTIDQCKEECSMPQAWPAGGCCFTCLSFDWFVNEGSTCDLSVEGPSTVALTAPGVDRGAYDNYALVPSLPQLFEDLGGTPTSPIPYSSARATATHRWPLPGRSDLLAARWKRRRIPGCTGAAVPDHDSPFTLSRRVRAQTDRFRRSK